MEFNHGVSIAHPDQSAAPPDALAEFTTENTRLRRLVGELLLKNQRLRQTSPAEWPANADDPADKTGVWQT